ncbi:MAG: hypothetical protein ABW071_00940 [Casimicrobiaceae bacterium]
MRRASLAALLSATFAIALAGPAAALTCYEILDRSDNVVYRGTIAPVDLSDKGAAEREALRKRGQHMIAMEVDRCIGVEYFTGSAGSAALTVDQIVGGIQTMRGSSPGGIAPPASGATSAPVPGAARPPAAAPAPAPRASGMSGSGTRSSY